MGTGDIPAPPAVAGAAQALHLRTRDPQDALSQLFARGRRHVLLEGGPTLLSAFLEIGRASCRERGQLTGRHGAEARERLTQEDRPAAEDGATASLHTPPQAHTCDV